MQFTFLTLVLLAGAAWYGWRAWSAAQSGVVEARLLPLPGLKVERLERAANPAAFRRAIGVFIVFAVLCLALAATHALGLLPRFGAAA